MAAGNRESDMQRANLRVHTWLSSALLTIGLVLLGYMVRSEGEPGALPLLLTLVGGAWLAATRLRGRREVKPGV
jgi:hypothetical protein